MIGQAELSETFTHRQARAAGVSDQRLYRLREAGELVELSRGVFRWADATPVTDAGFVAVARRAPRATVCLVSALVYWDLLDEVPAVIDIAVPRGAHRPCIDYPPVQVHSFAADTFSVGRCGVEVEVGERVPIYTAPRSVVDAVRLRHRVGTDIAYAALRRYLSRPEAREGELMRLARQLRAFTPVRDALQVLQ